MDQWEKETYALIDQLITKIINREENKISESEQKITIAIYEAIGKRYEDRSWEELQRIFSRLIKMRLPHPAVVLCFPGFKEKVEQIITFIPSLPREENQAKPSLEAAVMALYPYSKIIKDVNIGKIKVKFYLPKEKIAFIINGSKQNTLDSYLNYVQRKSSINFVILQSDEYINHRDLKRIIKSFSLAGRPFAKLR